MFKKTKQIANSGFTIIEVMIVLAIAGLIMVVVLVAVPQLQRNQRNEARKSIAARIVTELGSYAGNNNGRYPVASTSPAAKNFGGPGVSQGFFVRYFECTTAGGTTTCGTNINDPSTGTPVGVPAGDVTLDTTIVSDTVSVPGTVAGSISYGTKLLCDGETATSTGATSRNFVFQIRLEGGAVFCQDNR